MGIGNTDDIVHKEVIIIGNGPAAISLSLMLGGRVPFVSTDATRRRHPDELLAARLAPVAGHCLLSEDIPRLAAGLEGRTRGPASLLLDALLHPGADAGTEAPPLVRFRKAGIEIDHIVLGKGPPGGSWHRMDPYILTLSLGSWMSLPEIPFHCWDTGEKRAYAHNVAKYYLKYVEEMDLSKYFKNNCFVTKVEKYDGRTKCCDGNETLTLKKNGWLRRLSILRANTDDSESDEVPEENQKCFISNAINCLLKKKTRCKRQGDGLDRLGPNRKVREVEPCMPIPRIPRHGKRSVSFCAIPGSSNDTAYSSSFNGEVGRSSNISLRNSCSLDLTKVMVPFSIRFTGRNSNSCDHRASWLVEITDMETGEKSKFSCNYLVLATGNNDIPNRLEVFKDRKDPDWLVHDLRNLESKLDVDLQTKNPDEMSPVLIVGAGLSAADAVIAARARNIPVVHIFRHKSPELSKQLPENMYPEYHKVHEMMKDGGTTYPLYTAYPEYSLTNFDEETNTIILTSKTGEDVRMTVSYAAILIGSRPDLSFLPDDVKIGVNKELPIDCKTNPVDIDRLTHKVNGYDNLFVLGPLAGDNFVRFIPGGAVAVVAELYRQKELI